MTHKLIYSAIALLIVAVTSATILELGASQRSHRASSVTPSTTIPPTPSPVGITSTPDPTPTIIPGAHLGDWNTYRNESLGFELQYPSDWFVSGKATIYFSSYDTSAVPGRGGCCPGSNVRIIVSVSGEVNDWAGEAFTSPTALSIGGQPAEQGFVSVPPDQPQSNVLLTRVAYNDKLYDIGIQGSISEYIHIYNQILDSFKFLPI